jgi:hypothetical protein
MARNETSFKKNDPRINRNGRPKTFDAARALAQQIAHETAKVGGADMVIDGHKVTVTEAVLRSWAMSKDPRLQMAFMEWAYGKPPTVTQLEVSGPDDGPIPVELVNYRASIAETEG